MKTEPHPRTISEISSILTDPGVIAVIRAQNPEPIPTLARALVDGGITAIEITLTTPNALEAIHKTRLGLPAHALVGVGTVLDPSSCQAALDAGAEFVVTPVCRPDLIPIAHGAGRPIMIGAFTPTEAQLAHQAGTDFIKLFPADNLGPGYIRALRAPLPHLRIVPTGGVGLSNIAEFFVAGCAAVGVGSSLVPASMLLEEDWAGVSRRAAEFVAAARRGRK